MGKGILGILLTVLGILTFIYFMHDSLHIVPYPYNVVLQIFGNVIAVFGIYFALKGFANRIDLKDRRKFNTFKKDLMENGEKIEVDLTKCEIKENAYSEEVGNDYEVQMGMINTQLLDSIYDNDRATKSIEIDQTRLVFSYIHNGADEKFISPIIPKSAFDLNIKIYLHKTTSLYVDKNDRARYYFDLDFLKREE